MFLIICGNIVFNTTQRSISEQFGDESLAFFIAVTQLHWMPKSMFANANKLKQHCNALFCVFIGNIICENILSSIISYCIWKSCGVFKRLSAWILNNLAMNRLHSLLQSHSCTECQKACLRMRINSNNSAMHCSADRCVYWEYQRALLWKYCVFKGHREFLIRPVWEKVLKQIIMVISNHREENIWKNFITVQSCPRFNSFYCLFVIFSGHHSD